MEMVKVAVVVGGGGVTKGGTAGPDKVMRVRPWGRIASIVSPSIPSFGALALATTTRSTGMLDFGSHRGSAP
jgi:hypothetical protein